MEIYVQLFVAFLKIGFFGFGGGYAMLSLVQNEVVEQHGWLSSAEFTDIVAISQMTPGPIAINSATYVGYEVAGIGGSIVATLAVCLPSLTIMLLLTRFFIVMHRNRYIQGVVAGMKPVVVGMIGAAALLLIAPQPEALATTKSESFIDLWSWALFGATLIGCWRKVNPIWLIIASAVVGVIIYGIIPVWLQN